MLSQDKMMTDAVVLVTYKRLNKYEYLRAFNQFCYGSLFFRLNLISM